MYRTNKTSFHLASDYHTKRIKSKMKLEEIYLLVSGLILLTISFGIYYFIKRYLNNKPLGMQTILDQVVKDLIKTFIVYDILTWLQFGVRYTNQSIGHYLSLIVVLFYKFTYFALILQIIISVVSRYFYVFHQNILNHFEDSQIILMSRSLVGIVCLLVTLIEVPEAEYRHDYATLMQQEVDKEKLKQIDIDDLIIVLILGLIITAFVQVRIELFKKMVDSKSELNQMEVGTTESMENEMDPELRKNLLRFAMMLICFVFLVVIDWLLQRRLEVEDIFLSRLRMYVINRYINCNVAIIFIIRNPKLCKFCINEFKSVIGGARIIST